MDRLISYFVTLAVAAALMFAWDRHPAWGFHIPVLWFHVGFSLPDSLSVQRDKAVEASKLAAANLGQCHSNYASLSAAQATQEAAVASLRDQSAAWVAQSAKAASAASARADSYRQLAIRIEQETTGGDLCVAADRVLKGEAP